MTHIEQVEIPVDPTELFSSLTTVGVYDTYPSLDDGDVEDVPVSAALAGRTEMVWIIERSPFGTGRVDNIRRVIRTVRP